MIYIKVNVTHLEEMPQMKITGAEMTLAVTLEQGFLGDPVQVVFQNLEHHRAGEGTQHPWRACLGHLKYLLPVIQLKEPRRFRTVSQWLSSICPQSEWLNGTLLPLEQWSELSLVARVRVELCSWGFKLNIKSSNTAYPCQCLAFLIQKSLSPSSSENDGAFEERLVRPFHLLTAPAAARQDKWFTLQKIWWKPKCTTEHGIKGKHKSTSIDIKHFIMKGFLQISLVIFLILVTIW